ncbi:MAG TPA: cytochrome c biogenesis protein ResB [Pseudonocardiaceae bacterium]|nr:cytochrome c biogenesis protein ResB [Pseudonocardiaceae bacterium]
MRTALVLLFLLALAALPGSLLPQQALNPNNVATYISQHGWWGTLLQKLQFFQVFSSVWFAAIYVLLFVSLVGCLLPRVIEYGRQLTAKPVITPRNLARLPHHEQIEIDAPDVDPAAVLTAVRGELRGWRQVERDERDGARSVSAERGFFREAGNLVFHFAMVGLIVAFAIGKFYSYTGQVIVLANGSTWCNSGVLQYDSFTPGLRVDGTQLAPFCVKINDFSANYLTNGQPDAYNSDIDYQSGQSLASDTWQPYDLKVNSPLRTAGDRVYLINHGYAPQFTVTFPDGQVRTQVIQWQPDDAATGLSEGATKFDPPDVTDPAQLTKQQLAVTGLFAPTATVSGGLVTSTYPALNNPEASVVVYQGDLGEDSGTGQSIFTIDQTMVDQGKLKNVDAANMKPGDQISLKDGTKIKFDNVQQWVALQIAHDPTQDYVLIFAVFMLLGLITSLTVKRRRLWVRVVPAGEGETAGRTVVEIGGLARTDQAGYGEEFTRLSARLLDAAARATVGEDS